VAPASPAGTTSEAEAPANEPGLEEAGETWNPDETGETARDLPDDEALAVLQALERGEIGVDEAAERLERPGR